MVYLNLSVQNIGNTVEFYSNKLGLFDFQSNRRLICNIGVDLIIDLVEAGTEEHCQCYGQNEHAPSSFWISANLNEKHNEIIIIDFLKNNNVQYEETSNLGGHFLKFIDPSKNIFTIHADLGVFI